MMLAAIKAASSTPLLRATTGSERPECVDNARR